MLNIPKQLSETLPVIESKWNRKPKVGIILGTGLSKIAEKIDIEVSIPYSELPHFSEPTVKSHSGELLLGLLEGIPVVVMKGRLHYYEGYDMKTVTYPVRVMKSLGAETLIVSNAAGGLNPHFRTGDIMMISDHINFMGDNPLKGLNLDELGPRFPDMSNAYTRELRSIVSDVATDSKLRLVEGIYLGLLGPNLETPAECRFFRRIGVDALGMSTVPEVIVGVHSGMRVLGFSVITNMCLSDSIKSTSVEEIMEVAHKNDDKLVKLVVTLFNKKEFHDMM